MAEQRPITTAAEFAEEQAEHCLAHLLNMFQATGTWLEIAGETNLKAEITRIQEELILALKTANWAIPDENK